MLLMLSTSCFRKRVPLATYNCRVGWLAFWDISFCLFLPPFTHNLIFDYRRTSYTVVAERVGYFVFLNYSYNSWSIIKT